MLLTFDSTAQNHRLGCSPLSRLIDHYLSQVPYPVFDIFSSRPWLWLIKLYRLLVLPSGSLLNIEQIKQKHV